MEAKRVGFLGVLLLAGLLSACKGMQDAATTDSTTDSTTTTNTSTGSGTTTQQSVSLGSGTGTSFASGQLNIGVTSLSAGGQTSITATLVDTITNSLYTTPVDVAFSSSCSGQGLATLTTPITSSGGTAVTTYQATGCEGTDTIIATATVNGTSLSATGTVSVQPAVVGSLAFVSVTPQQIGLKGTGLTEAATVVFLVKDQNGNPVPNKQVNFVLRNNTGGTSLSSSSDTSTAEGLVQTTVNAGTVPETVKVEASYAADPTIRTQSDGLVISTGIADNDSFSLSAESLNVEGLEYDGIKVKVNVYAADHYNNPVPDGSSVLFHTEGGQIGSSCTTVAGGCTVEWTSSNPRPADGRSTITATMIGEESFTDLDGDGYFNNSDTFVDLPEAFRDYNEDGVRNAGEEFYDYTGDYSYTPGDNLYNGVLCKHATLCAGDPGVHVRRNLVIVMSGSTAYVTPSSSPITIPLGGVYQGTISIADANGQVMPTGTTVNISTTNGRLISEGSHTIHSTSQVGPTTLDISLEPDGTSDSGLLIVKVTTPKKTVTTRSFTVED